MLRRILQYPLTQGLILAVIVVAATIPFRPREVVAVDVENPLLVSTRQGLAICVQSVDITVSTITAAQAVSTIKNSVSSLKSYPAWKHYDSYRLAVDYGCPGSPYLTAHENAREYPMIPKTERPSKYRAFVYLVSEEWLEANLPEPWPRIWSQEAVCEDHNCAAVSEGIYITLAEFNQPTKLGDNLAKGLGLKWMIDYVPDNAQSKK